VLVIYLNLTIFEILQIKFLFNKINNFLICLISFLISWYILYFNLLYLLLHFNLSSVFCILKSSLHYSLARIFLSDGKTERSGSDKREEIPRSKQSTSVERTNGNRFGIGMLPMQAAGAGGDWSSFTKWISRMHKVGEKIVKRYARATAPLPSVR